MINNIYPDLGKEYGKQQHEQLLRVSENDRLLGELKNEARLHHRPHRVSHGFARKLAVAMILVALSGLVFVTIAVAAGI